MSVAKHSYMAGKKLSKGKRFVRGAGRAMDLGARTGRSYWVGCQSKRSDQAAIESDWLGVWKDLHSAIAQVTHKDGK